MVTDILTEGKMTVSHESGEDLDGVELGGEFLSLLRELLVVFLSPPSRHVAFSVEKTSLVIETVAHLVADDNSDSTVVHGLVSVGVEERRLKDSSGEADFVGGGIVISVHGLRRHSPPFTVSGLSEVSHIVGGIPGAGCAEVVVVALRRIDLE